MLLGTISTFENEVDLVVEWSISQFSTLEKNFYVLEHSRALCYSPDFSFGGEKWELWIYLNVWWDNSPGHLDLALYKWSSSPSVRQSFSLSLKTAEGKRHEEVHLKREFGGDNMFHTINRFIPKSELLRKRSDLLPDDVLTVVCTMKRSTSAESESDSASDSAEISTPDSGECRHCRGNFAAGGLSSHQRKCPQRPVKCPDCSKVVLLQKWFDEHQCQQERPEGEDYTSGSSASAHEKKVAQDLRELFLQKEDCDVVFRVKGSEIPAHRAILKARSPMLASTFRRDMKESATGFVEIEDCDLPPFWDFLYFLYCGDIAMIGPENVFSLYTLADKYEVLGLKAECLDFIRNNMAVDTFCKTISLALRHSETELIASATDFFVANAEEILLTVEWQTFVAENPTHSNELFIKFVTSVKH